MNTDLTGTVRMAGETDTGIRVEIHLDHEVLRLMSQYGELGQWPLSDVGVSARLDGFHIKVEGEELILSTNDDARFALALGIRSSSSPRLNRLLANARDQGVDVDGQLTPDAPILRPIPPTKPVAILEESRAPIALGMLTAAGAMLVGGIVAVGNASPVRIFGLMPIWPVWIIGALSLGLGGFAVLTRMRHGRLLVWAGVGLGILALAGSLFALNNPGFSWISDGVVLGGAGTVLAALLLMVETLNRAE
ncbi:MAG: hypothetical protein ACT4OP_00880 [Actinomycetota bacterium]